MYSGIPVKYRAPGNFNYEWMKIVTKIFSLITYKTAGTLICILIVLFTGFYSAAQPYLVEKAPFSTKINDEFAPVFYANGIVFCSNQRDNSPVGFNSGPDRLYKIYYIEKGKGASWKSARLLSDQITTSFHDGPATFNGEGSLLYFSRNNSVGYSLRNIKDTTNKLGIYSAEKLNGLWTNIRPFAHNNPLWNFTTPSISPDGRRLYFASDMPGGQGGMDLYYCERCENSWCDPVNFGRPVNTSGNETFPYADYYGKVYFASDGHGGLGGKDLFFTLEEKYGWIAPISMDSAINSTADDFALVMDSTSTGGFFSSNRLSSDDIFIFRSEGVKFSSCDTVRETNFCFTLYDERHSFIDTLPVIYRWDFGQGIIRTGSEVHHCFPGPGNYTVRLDIFDQLTGDTMIRQTEYPVHLEASTQPGISTANLGITGKPLTFKAEFPEIKDMIVTGYLWDYGDGFKPGTPETEHIFKKPGIYDVKLGLTGKNNVCVSKEIRIFGGFQELERSVATTNQDYLSWVLMMDDLAKPEKSALEDLFKGMPFIINFNQQGITSDSYPFLDKVSKALQNDPGLRLEIILYMFVDSSQYKRSDHLAAELGFYLKNSGSDVLRYSSHGGDIKNRISKQPGDQLNYTGIVEFFFMKGKSR